MSDTQDPVYLRQRQMQQRQILAMMGIGQWVQPNSPTINMADIPVVEAASNIDDRLSNHQINNNQLDSSQLNNDQQPTMLQPVSIDADNGVGIDPDNESTSDENYAGYYSLAANQPSSSVDNTEEQAYSHEVEALSTLAPVISPALAAATSPVRQVAQTIEPLLESFSVEAPAAIEVTVAPFDLQAGRYGDWVLVVDIQALTNDSQKLWQNIAQALSISCTSSSFPICAGMDTAELANASLAGYLFKIGRSEDIRVAVLTALPDGLTHPNFTSVPTLDAMLADANLKRQLWQQLAT